MAPREGLPEDLDTALNEASWRGLLLDEEQSRVEIALQVLSLPDGDGGVGTVDVVLELGRVGRLAASLRRGRWDDDSAAVIPLDAAQLGDVVASFRGAAIY